MHNEIMEKVKSKIATKQKKHWGRIERNLRNIISSGGIITDELKICTPEKAATMMDIINMTVQDRLFILVWYDYHKKVDIIWGRITGRETKLPSKDPLVSIRY